MKGETREGNTICSQEDYSFVLQGGKGRKFEQNFLKYKKVMKSNDIYIINNLYQIHEKSVS